MFIEEIPASGCESGTPLTIEERIRFRETVVRYRERASGGAFIVHSPGDEEFFGGCVSAGRGFAHVNPSADCGRRVSAAGGTRRRASRKPAPAAGYLRSTAKAASGVDESSVTVGPEAIRSKGSPGTSEMTNATSRPAQYARGPGHRP